MCVYVDSFDLRCESVIYVTSWHQCFFNVSHKELSHLSLGLLYICNINSNTYFVYCIPLNICIPLGSCNAPGEL